jgi:hypothetical protein
VKLLDSADGRFNVWAGDPAPNAKIAPQRRIDIPNKTDKTRSAAVRIRLPPKLIFSFLGRVIEIIYFNGCPRCLQ